jgi:hypothetical protein
VVKLLSQWGFRSCYEIERIGLGIDGCPKLVGVCHDPGQGSSYFVGTKKPARFETTRFRWRCSTTGPKNRVVTAYEEESFS